MAFTMYGAFAEEVKTEARRVIRIPAGMDFERAAAFGMTYATSDHALRDRGVLQPGETLLVLGAAGGVGIAAIEIGKALGARVIACASTDNKLAVCREHGADAIINYATENVRERSGYIRCQAGTGHWAAGLHDVRSGSCRPSAQPDAEESSSTNSGLPEDRSKIRSATAFRTGCPRTCAIRTATSCCVRLNSAMRRS